MPRDKKNDYFALLEEMAEYFCTAAKQLEKILTHFHIDHCKQDLIQLQLLTQAGNEQRDLLTDQLMREFITPVAREDLFLLVGQMVCVADAIEDVLLNIDSFGIRTISKECLDFTILIGRYCELLKVMVLELRYLKKTAQWNDALKERNVLTNKTKTLYQKAVRKLSVTATDAILVTAWAKIYCCQRQACDLCAQTIERMEYVLIKNT